MQKLKEKTTTMTKRWSAQHFEQTSAQNPAISLESSRFFSIIPVMPLHFRYSPYYIHSCPFASNHPHTYSCVLFFHYILKTHTTTQFKNPMVSPGQIDSQDNTIHTKPWCPNEMAKETLHCVAILPHMKTIPSKMKVPRRGFVVKITLLCWCFVETTINHKPFSNNTRLVPSTPICKVAKDTLLRREGRGSRLLSVNLLEGWQKFPT